jgi:hypothetical protein
LYAPDGRLYEITNIASNTSFTIAPAYLGTTASGQSYVIVPSQSYIRDLASQAADLVNQYSTIANFAGQGKFGDGTVSAPGIRFSDDLDTGLYRIGSNNLGISAGGTKIVDVSSSGITVTGTINGTTLPTSATLVTTTGTQTLTNKTLTAPVIGTISNTGTLTLPTSTDTLVGRNTTDTLTNKTLSTGTAITAGTINGATIGATTASTGAFTNLSYTGTLTGSTGILNIGSGQIYKDASGGVGIGTTAPLSRLDVNGGDIRLSTNATYLRSTDAAGTATRMLGINASNSTFIGPIDTYAGGNIQYGVAAQVTTHQFFTGGSERMRITSTGNVGIGASSPDNNLEVASSAEVPAIAVRASGTTRRPAVYLMRGTSGVFGAQGRDFRIQNDVGVLTFSDGFNSAVNERMRIDASGNVGIGTTAPAARLDLGTATATDQIQAILARQASPGDANFRLVAKTGAGTGGDAEFFKLGINHVNGGDNACINFFRGGGTTGGFLTFTTNNNTERARIDSSGNLLLGTTNTAPSTNNVAGIAITPGGISVTGAAAVDINRNSNGIVQTIRRSGTIVGSINVSETNTAYNTSSDQRLKENIVDAPSASDSIDAIQIRSFDWKVDGSHQKYGVIAQELEAIAPEAVFKGEKEEDMWGVDYSKLVPMMVKAIQEQQAQIEQLRAEIETLKGA